MTSTQAFDCAIIGGGAAGTLLAIRLLQGAAAGMRIAMIEPGTPGRGVAYGSDNPAHVLNVHAGGMSALAEQPDDFVNFLRQRDGDAQATSFVSRCDYAAYLAQRLSDARASTCGEFVHIRTIATRLAARQEGIELLLDDGTCLTAQQMALASGNQPRGCPFNASDAQRVLSAWDHPALESIGVDDAVVLTGSGLSMVDVVLGLQARGYRGAVTVVSRHGLLPLPHATKKQRLQIDLDALHALGVRKRMRYLRAIAARTNTQDMAWQDVMDALRHHVRELWHSLSEAEQRRFLRHAVRHWDVHRHRIPNDVAKQLHALRDAGGLRVIAGRVQAVRDEDHALAIDVAARNGEARTLQAQWLVNATGIETRAARFSNPLLQAMLQDGHARPGPHGWGIDTDDEGAVISADGTAQPCIAALGSLRLGNLWEATAVPDLRVDAEQLAARWLSARDSHTY